MKTDPLMLAIPARKLPAVTAANALRYDQIHMLRREHEVESDRTQGYLKARAEMTPLTSSDAVFCFSDNGQTLMGKYEKPRRDVIAPTPLCSWCDLTEEEACSTVLGGQSSLVQGSPGLVRANSFVSC